MTTKTLKVQASAFDSDSCLVWLDRSYKDLLQWKRKLQSYLFEPTTLRQFEIKQQLSDKMEALVKRHRELLKLVQNGTRLIGNHVEMIKGYLAETRQLEDRVQQYMGMIQPNN